MTRPELYFVFNFLAVKLAARKLKSFKKYFGGGGRGTTHRNQGRQCKRIRFIRL